MRQQPWFNHPFLKYFKGKGTKLMFPCEGNIYEVFLENTYEYDYKDNNGCMGVIETPVNGYLLIEYVAIDWNEEGVTVKGLDRDIKIVIEWDRIYPIPS